MDNATFDKLPDPAKLALVLDLASTVLGKEAVERSVASMTPLLRDLIGHGAPPPTIAGDAPTPEDNFWGGVWQVYDLE